MHAAMVGGRGRRGASTVETAVVLLPFFLLVFGILEYGRFVMVRNLMDSAARDGARFASVNVTGADTTAVIRRVTDALAGQQGALRNLSITVYKSDAAGADIGGWKTAAFGEPIAVQVTGSYKPMIPLFGELALRARSLVRSEAP